jgi:dTDP-4-dehydrorhamnose reductase
MTKTVMVLGADGMLGHRVFHEFMKDKKISTIGVCRDSKHIRRSNMFEHVQPSLVWDFDATNWEAARATIRSFSPDYVINCVGIIKQRPEESKNTKLMIQTNALFPHLLAEEVSSYGGTTINFSSDCIFLGDHSDEPIAEDCEPNAWSLYGRTKYLGETGKDKNSLTLRTSFIGFEIKGYTSLLEWFFSAVKQQKLSGAEIRGFRAAKWSGVSTAWLSGLLTTFVRDDWKIRGVYQLATEKPIDKYELLCLISETLGFGAKIVADDAHVPDKVCNRWLDGTRFENDSRISVGNWPEMVQGLRDDYAVYRAVHPERYKW